MAIPRSYAGTTNFNFATDPTTLVNPDSSPTIWFAGTHNWTNSGAANYFWKSTGGQAGDGYVSIVDNIANQGLVAVMPCLDPTNAPIAAFTVDVDLRVGNPTNANSRPADGFSISFARPSDLVISNATPPAFGGLSLLNGFAGGSSLANARPANPGTANAENGTKTGIAVVFDAFIGGWLPDGATNTSGTTDAEGIELRVDDMTLIQFPLADRNGNCSNMTCNATACSDINSIQTGPFLGTTNVANNITNLCWQHLKIQFTNNQMSVTWKGRTAINTNYPYWSPTAGRIVIAGRNGGSCENVHMDNLVITTYPDTNSYLQGVIGKGNGFMFTLADYSNHVASVTQVLLDNTDVTSLTSITPGTPVTLGNCTLTTNLPSYTRHLAAVIWQTDTGLTRAATNVFLTPVFTTISTNGMLPLSAIDTTKPGFLVNAWQTRQNNPNGLAWTEQQVIGLRGSNVIGSASVPSEGGSLVWDGPLDFDNVGGAKAGPGYFGYNFDFNVFGISQGERPPAPGDIYDECALEMFGYVYFPTSGFYSFVIGSDDSYQLSFSQSPYDRMGTVIASLQGNRLPTSTSPPVGTDVITIFISQPGCYPFRLMYQNGAANAGLEWYTFDANNSTTPYTLVNDTNTPGALLTYRATAASSYGPYIKRAVPVRNDPYAVFFQPVVVDLGDGTGNQAVDTTTISLSIDGTPQTFTLTRSGATTHIVQTLTNFWSTSTHTNIISFNDLNGTNYIYSWQFTVLGGAVAPTNSLGATSNIVYLSAASRVDPSNLSQQGFRIHSHQMAFKQSNSIGTAEEEFEDLHGANIADQTQNTGPGYFSWNDIIDFRKASGTGTGAGAEYNVDFSFSQLGINTVQFGSTQNNVDNCALEIGAWLVFPYAGPYIMHLNTDDGNLLTMPPGNYIFGKLGNPLILKDVGGGSSGESSTGLAGGQYVVINIPTPGAYAFRLLTENGTGDAAAEWSMYQPLPDGTVAKVPINDPGNPNAIKAYQVSSVGGPYVSYVNPAPLSKDIVFYQPVVIDITDGPSQTTSPAQIDAFTIDGVVQAYTAYKTNGNRTHIVQTLTSPWAPNTSHTNVLVYHDSLSTSYSNYWTFTTLNISPYGAITVPLTNMVPLASLSQPGFRIKPYQVTTNTLGSTIAGWEGVLEGLAGPNIADLTATNGPGYFSWNGVVDFNNAGTAAANAANGEWEWDFNPSGFGIQPNTTGSSGTTANLENYSTLDIGGWLYFPSAGTFIMEVDADDDFRLTSPYGNPFNKDGAYFSSVEGGHGAAGSGFGPRTGTTYFTVNVPAPGGYPFRFLWANITGGGGVEWNIFQYLPDGSVAQVMVGDTNTPGAIQVFQTSTLETPYVAFMSPIPGNILPGQPAITLTGNTAASTATNNGPVQTDIIIGLADDITSVNTNTIQLLFNGVSQPITITVSNGMNIVTRPANSATWWPSGQVGTLMLVFQDNLGRTINMPLTTMATPFWGTISGGYPLGAGDTNKPGYQLRTVALDGSGTTAMATRIHTAEQALAGLWGTDVSNPKGTNNGYFVIKGTGPGAGVINFNPAYASSGTNQIGDFRLDNGFSDQLTLLGIPSTASTTSQRTNSFACEFLAYVQFPAAGVYTLGVNSDDGFRLTSGFSKPANNGALRVNTPAALGGFKPTVQDSFLSSYSLTNPVTGALVLAQGPYGSANPYGSTNFNNLGYSVDGCLISNGAQLAGNIALIYRSVSCGFVQQVQNAAAAGAIAVVFVQNQAASAGWFPTEATVSPIQPIPAVMIDQTTALNLIAAMATNSVNVTLTPMDYLINPPPAQSPLGQFDGGRGSADTLFPLVVQQPGTYPLRLIYYQGSGGGNVEFFSVVGGTRMLINDGNNANALRAYSALAAPSLTISNSGTALTITYTGTLKTSTDPGIPIANWTTVPGSSPLVIPLSSSSPKQFFRSVY
jgi:PA domain